MTRRRYARRHRHPLLTAALVFLVLIVAMTVIHWAGFLLTAAVAGAAGYAISEHRAGRRVIPGRVIPPGPLPKPPPGPPPGTAERDRLAAQVADLTTQLAQARASATAAWDAAAARPPKAPAEPQPSDVRSRLLSDPLSGTRPLGGAS
jgi:hypothetical protein